MDGITAVWLGKPAVLYKKSYQVSQTFWGPDYSRLKIWGSYALYNVDFLAIKALICHKSIFFPFLPYNQESFKFLEFSIFFNIIDNDMSMLPLRNFFKGPVIAYWILCWLDLENPLEDAYMKVVTVTTKNMLTSTWNEQTVHFLYSFRWTM